MIKNQVPHNYLQLFCQSGVFFGDLVYFGSKVHILLVVYRLVNLISNILLSLTECSCRLAICSRYDTPTLLRLLPEAHTLRTENENNL